MRKLIASTRSFLVLGQDNVEDLAHLAFWNYNTTLLLHLLRSDSGLEISCHEMSLLVMLEVSSTRVS